MGLTVIHQQGGMREFEKTGIYPGYLLFNLPGTRKIWRIKIKEKPQSGFLKCKGNVVYEYKFDGCNCKLRSVNDDYTFSEWKEPEIMSNMMID